MFILHYQSDGEFNVQLYQAGGRQFLLFSPLSQITFGRVTEAMGARGLSLGDYPDYQCLIAAFPHLKKLRIACPGDIDLPNKQRVGWRWLQN